LAIVVPFVEDCFAKTTFADSHGGRFLPYAASRIIHHSQGRDRFRGTRRLLGTSPKGSWLLKNGRAEPSQ